ncbi:MAG: ATP-binding protein [Candidatus Sumerlaeota bacterium]|nr:ATP-binding protein [Candidatus Sumerlaeota bacterium]
MGFLNKIPGAAAFGVLALTLLVYNLGGWYLYEMARDLAEREMERKLEAIGRTAALELNEENTPLLLLLDPKSGIDPYTNWSPYASRLQRLRARLAAIRDANGLRSISILGRNLAVLADADPGIEPGTMIGPMDASLIEQVFTSNTVTVSPYYRFNDQEHKRCYAPLRSQRGAPCAVLRITAGRDYFTELGRLKLYLIAIAGAGSLLLILVALALWRLLAVVIQSQQAMADADRLQALGTLAAGIAHEIRNPLGIIRAISEELEAELEGQPEQQAMLEDITGEVERLNRLVNQFLVFARPGAQGVNPQPFHLDEVLNDVVQLVRKGSDKREIVYVMEHVAKPSPLVMEEKSIRQVLLNVLINARDAVNEKGTIHIALDEVGRFARIVVRDNGCGIDARQIKQVFEPFFTTKPAGTGLGLPISRSIVERYGGKIHIESELGKGTTVTIQLPVGEEGKAKNE